jgi:hypothetical protein
MKLVSTDFIRTFNPTSQMVYFYRQDGDFALDEEANLAESIDAGLTLAKDNTPRISFFNSTHVKFFNFS